MKKCLPLFFALAVCQSCYAQTAAINIIPAPVKATVEKGMFTISPGTVIVMQNQSEQPTVDFFNWYLQKFYGFRLQVVQQATSNFISFTTLVFVRAPDKPERYTLQADVKSIRIQGDGQAGTFYGMQTLIQLLPPEKQTTLQIPCVSVEDYPRFAYRGLHLDCGRHFFDVDFIKRYIDFIALSKMNTFHWHLTEDQGWRLEIKKYPLLTQVGGCRNGAIIGHHPGSGNDGKQDCGYYTQEQVRDIVRYAADRYVNIIPEIEMPGHASAAIAAYPQLSCFPDEPTKPLPNTAWNGPDTGKQVQQSWSVHEDVFCPSEYTFNFLQDVLDEVMELFPSTYIHIGGDECPKTSWKRSEFCQQLIKEKGLKDEHGLQSYFIGRIEKYLNTKGHQIIGWDEILEGGVAPNATVMSWRGEQGGIEAAKQHHNVIMTPTTYVYFDYAPSKQEDSLTIGGFLPIEKVYSYDPLPSELNDEEKKYILGAQANVWSEYMVSGNKVTYMIFPRLSALSEVLWSPKESKNWNDFKNRMQQQTKRYELWHILYNKAPY